MEVSDECWRGEDFGALRSALQTRKPVLRPGALPYQARAPQQIRDLHSATERERAPIGVFITAALPTTPMLREAAAVGRFEGGFGRTYPKLQIITLAELFQGKKPDTPFVDPASVKRAKREEGSQGQQESML